MRAHASALALLLAPSVALAEGGGGVTFNLEYLPRWGRPVLEHEAPGWVGCIGGMGYGVSRRDFRIGGEGTFCRGQRDGVSQAYGGVQLGWWRGRDAFYLTGYGTVGFGVLTDATVPDQSAYTAIHLFVKPTFAVGVALGPTALEFGLYSLLPINLVQFTGDVDGRGVVTPQVGVQISLLFGDFRRESRRASFPQRPGTCTPACAPNCVGPQAPCDSSYGPRPNGPPPQGPPPQGPPPSVQGQPATGPDTPILDPESALPAPDYAEEELAIPETSDAPRR